MQLRRCIKKNKPLWAVVFKWCPTASTGTSRLMLCRYALLLSASDSRQRFPRSGYFPFKLEAVDVFPNTSEHQECPNSQEDGLFFGDGLMDVILFHPSCVLFFFNPDSWAIFLSKKKRINEVTELRRRIMFFFCRKANCRYLKFPPLTWGEWTKKPASGEARRSQIF